MSKYFLEIVFSRKDDFKMSELYLLKDGEHYISWRFLYDRTVTNRKIGGYALTAYTFYPDLLKL